MSDQDVIVEILKEALFDAGALPGDPTFAALDALVAERDRRRSEQDSLSNEYCEALGRNEALTQRIATLEVACDFYSEDHGADCGCTGCITVRRISISDNQGAKK